MNPYLPIRKVPLDYNGVKSSAFSVQMNHPSPTMVADWKECGVVGNSYMLLPNEEVKQAAKQVAEELTAQAEGRRVNFEHLVFVQVDNE